MPNPIRLTAPPLLIGSLVAALALPCTAAAQEPTDSLRREVARLRAQVDSLMAVLQRMQEGTPERAEAEDELERLRAAAAAAAGPAQTDTAAAPEGEQQFVGRQRSLQALNPEISVTGDLFAIVDPDATNEDNFVDREFELSFQSTLDPFSRAKIFVSRHVPGAEIAPFGEDAHGGEDGEAEEGHGGEFAIEEGYVQWVNLPGGLGLTLGKFFQRFGTHNRWHGHALPFQTRSLPHLAFIGEEALAQTGVSLYWLAPVEGAGTYEVWVDVTRSGNETLFGESEQPSVLGHLNAFWELGQSLDLDLGLSAVAGEHVDGEVVFDQRLYGLETALTWRPPGRSRYQEAVFRGGVMVLDPGKAAVGLSPRQALGVWTMGEYRLSQQWIVGARYDRVENPLDTSEVAWLVSPTLTWWQSEWVRLRAEYDLLGHPDGRDTDGQFLLQVTFAMGPHKHETY